VFGDSHLASHFVGLAPGFHLLDRANHLPFVLIAFTHPLSPYLRPLRQIPSPGLDRTTIVLIRPDN
jgi:hypothetical protein